MNNPFETIPQVAVVCRNQLMNIGLVTLLQDIMPMIKACVFPSTADLKKEGDSFFHYFISVDELVENPGFYFQMRRHTIILGTAKQLASMPSDFFRINVDQDEEKLAAEMLRLQQFAHRDGMRLPEKVKEEMKAEETKPKEPLSPREVEVLTELVKGYINKEIADHLNIGLTTVISHRKNLIRKLNIRSVSGLTIYAVMHGYVKLEEI